MVDKPRWSDDPPPGFKPDGTSLIAESKDAIQWPGDKVKGPDGKLYSPEEYAEMLKEGGALIAAEQGEGDDDLSDLDEVAALGSD